MAETAEMSRYRAEYIAGFEQRASKLMGAATTEFIADGKTVYFLVGDSGGAEAVTRGLNGLIPGRPDNLNQIACTLQEWHDKPKKTGFNIFTSQGDQRSLMQQTSMGTIYRKLDDLMIAQLSTGTINMGAAAAMSVARILDAVAKLGDAEVDTDNEDNIFCAVTPKALSTLEQTPEFSSGDYVEIKPFAGGGPAQTYRRVKGINFIKSSRLLGRGTADEKCLLWHRDAIGYAAKAENLSVGVGYNDEDDYYYARGTLFGNAKLIQNSGVVLINHLGV